MPRTSVGDSIKPPSARNPLLAMREPAFADGGKVETTEELMKRMAAKYGTTGATQAAPVAPPPVQPAPQPAPQPAAKGIGGAFDALKNRKSQIDRAVDGYSHGGKIKGPGTSTSDSIPAQVAETGEPIAVSNEERILSGAQDAFMEKLARFLGYESLDSMLEAATGKPVGPTVKVGRRAAADGLPPEQNPLTTDVFRNGNSFTQNLSAPQPTAAPAPASPVVRNAFGNDMTATIKMQNAIDTMQAGPGPRTSSTTTNPLTAMANSVSQSAPSMMSSTRSAYQAGSVDDPHAVNPLVTAQPKRDAPYQEAARNSPVQNMMTPIDSLFPSVRRFAFGGSIDPNRDYSIPEDQVISARQATASVAPTASPSPAAIRSPSQVIQPRAQERTFSQPVATNPLLDYRPTTTVAQKANAFVEKGTREDMTNPLTTIGMSANNESLAKANAIRQSMIDGDGTGPKVTMLGNSGLSDTQALMDKWSREDGTAAATQAAIANPKVAGAIASLASSQQATDANRYNSELARQTNAEADATRQAGQQLEAGVTMRGQDISSRDRAAQLAGNPLANELTKTQTAAMQSELDDKKALAAMVAEIGNPTTDSERRKALTEAVLASHGKSSALTLPQTRDNLEIDSARQAIAGLSPEEIRRRTAKTTNTGRDNPDFDPALERAVGLANRRKIGDDPFFDERQSRMANPGTNGDSITRFRADPAMKGYSLGKQTANGTEVFDPSGRLVGHYQ